ncbi:MAG: hypothetical protein K6A41_02050 [Bacteroidales bacterium]|nr:hypothetical protein [Bacteroidales bacterium]
MGIILHNEQLGFGYYKGYTLSQVCKMDGPYVKWLIENDEENVYELYDIDYWTDVFENYHNFLPKDGLYLLAFRDDNHIDYKLEYYTAGTNIQNHYPLDGEGRDWFHCLAYHYIPEFSTFDKKWKCLKKEDFRPNLYSVYAVRNVSSQIKYVWADKLFDFTKESIEEFHGCFLEKDGEVVFHLYDEDCGIAEEWTFLGEFYVGIYSETHHGNHNRFCQYLFDNCK